MKCLLVILVSILLLIAKGMALADDTPLLNKGASKEMTQVQAPLKEPVMIHRNRIILVNNPYADKVRVDYICVYLYKDPWKGICEKITKKHPGFVLKEGERLVEIQRIGLIGKSLEEPFVISECLVYFDHSNDALKRLENSSSYIAQVNYVLENDMVCSLLKES